MKDIYLRAAETVYEMLDMPSCSAIFYRSKNWKDHCLKRHAYSELFTPRPHSDHNSVWGNQWSENEETRKQCRVLALLFMHWIYQDELKERKK